MGMDSDDLLSRLFPGRAIRPGTPEFPYKEILRRQPDFFTRLHLKRALAEFRFSHRRSESYLAFQLFHPSVILNYNLDGLASDLCDRRHRVIAAHHTVAHRYGSPEAAEFLHQCGSLIGLFSLIIFCFVPLSPTLTFNYSAGYQRR